MSNPISLESGRGYVLAACAHCPPWRRMTGARAHALLLAADHATYVHGDARLAAQLREQAAKVKSDTPTK